MGQMVREACWWLRDGTAMELVAQRGRNVDWLLRRHAGRFDRFVEVWCGDWQPLYEVRWSRIVVRGRVPADGFLGLYDGAGLVVVQQGRSVVAGRRRRIAKELRIDTDTASAMLSTVVVEARIECRNCIETHIITAQILPVFSKD